MLDLRSIYGAIQFILEMKALTSEVGEYADVLQTHLIPFIVNLGHTP